ncbi:MAG: phenylalanine--tRNA ligase subunit beta [bacterium]
MNILTSYNWVKEYLKTNLSPEDFAREMSLKSMSVESTEVLSERFEKMVVGVIEEIKDHLNADKLKIVVTDVGEKVEIVCGGSNIAEGMRVWVALPGAKVRWHGEGNWVELEEAEIRGVKSTGMICSPVEVGFEKAPCPPGGIWDLSELTDASAGTPVAEALGLDDTIFDIEITTNRPDAMSIVGLAREGAAAIDADLDFTPPELPTEPESPVLPLKVSVRDGDLCPRYMAVAMDNIKVGPSPAWLQIKLLLAGHRPINNIVDITNLVLHEYGQPLHAFDYEKLEGEEIVVRRAKDGEKFLALDENEYELTDANLVIADKRRPVAIGGVMGGQESGTWEGTNTIVFEAASFDPVSVRRTARSLNLYSDSQLVFEKGLSTEMPALALARAIELAREIAGGKTASEVIDVREHDYEPLSFPFRSQKVRDLMGVDLEEDEMIKILEKLGFKIEKIDHELRAIVPFWRDHDIENEVDLTEEVARIYGYHNLPSVIPQSPPPTIAEDPALVWETWTKNLLASAGYTELFSLSFLNADDMVRYGIDPADALALYNPLSSDLTHMRTSLMPSLLKAVDANQGEVPAAKVFELSRIYKMQEGDLPDEHSMLTIAEYGLENIEEAFLSIKGVLEMIAQKAGLKLELDCDVDENHWHPNRSARVIINDQPAGTIGQIAESDREAFKIDRPVVVAEIDIECIIPQMHKARRYNPIPEYPAITRDLAIIVDEKAEFESISELISEQSSIIESVNLFDVYRGTGVPEGKKSIAISIILRAPDKTLSSQYAEDVMDEVTKVLKEQFDAVMR